MLLKQFMTFTAILKRIRKFIYKDPQNSGNVHVLWQHSFLETWKVKFHFNKCKVWLYKLNVYIFYFTYTGTCQSHQTWTANDFCHILLLLLSERNAHKVMAMGFLSHYVNCSLPYVQCHITRNNMCWVLH